MWEESRWSGLADRIRFTADLKAKRPPSCQIDRTVHRGQQGRRAGTRWRWYSSTKQFYEYICASAAPRGLFQTLE